MRSRPAETTAAGSAFALLIARVFGVDDVETVTALAVATGFVPAIVTFVVEQARRR